MSKKRIYKKHLEKGRFYIHNDRHGGHPSYLFRKRDKKNYYLVIIFTSSPGPKRTKLKKSIEPMKIKTSFVHNSPTIAKRRDLGSKNLVGLKKAKMINHLLKILAIKNDSQKPTKDFYMRTIYWY